MPRKGYRPKFTRTKFPLTVEQQRTLLKKTEGDANILLALLLSTGMHPDVLANKGCVLEWTETYVAWKRPKTYKAIQFPWSKLMKPRTVEIKPIKDKSRQWYWQLVRDAGRKVGISGLCPLQCRHTYFVNRARLGHNAYDIAHSSGTDMETVYNHYTTGMSESKNLEPEDRAFLEQLMEP